MTGNRTENLFRREAIRSLRRNPLGRPICLMPRPWMWFNCLLAVLLVAVAIFLGNVEYARKEVARGWLVSRPGVIRITHNAQASIRKVIREPGESVAAGDILVYLSNDAILPGGQSKDELSLQRLRNDIAEIDTQLQLSQQRLSIQSKSLHSQLREIDTEIAAINQRIHEQRRNLQIGQEQLDRIVDAATQGAVSDWSLMQQQRDRNALEQELNSMQQNLASLQRSREAIVGQQVALPIDAQAGQSGLRVQRSRLAQQIFEMETRQLSVLTSPISGTVTSVDVHAGNNVSAGQLLMTILPNNFDLGAELYVPSRAAGLIRHGQTVHLNYDAFPYQKYGVFPGYIEHISEYVSLPTDLPQPFPMLEVSYKVRVRIDDTRIKTDLGDAELRPGMLLIAEIVLESRSLMDWLFEPLDWHSGQRA